MISVAIGLRSHPLKTLFLFHRSPAESDALLLFCGLCCSARIFTRVMVDFRANEEHKIRARGPALPFMLWRIVTVANTDLVALAHHLPIRSALFCAEHLV
jgi:hypothetical protein